MRISLLMDVEDPIDPISDDAAKTCADTLWEVGVPGTFMVVGEKARKLVERQRQDVVDSLNRHSVGLHSDMHSIHPVVLEYLEGLSWEDGVEEAVRREGRGVEAIRAAFGREPCAWGGPGNIWGPQITEACRRLGIPAVVYALTRLRNHDVHRFLGVLHYPHGLCMSDTDYSFRDKLTERLAWLEGEFLGRAAAGVEWTEIFLGHPTRIYHEEFWDIPNFAGGRLPPAEAWVMTERKSPTHLAQALSNFRYAVERIGELPGIDIIGLDEANSRYGSATPEPVTEEEIAEVWPQSERVLDSMRQWVILDPRIDLSGVIEHTRQRLPTLERVRIAPAS